ncbi:hypothetical protein Ddye_003221 [Dipteronia dyeriana]|uniref:DUF4005 domain-containing protein n=1 Tax=Dipteronia dyeriana TaxID=168575 RepID=A0AAE0CV38_9ROSI|nr:hypothetical protein Ddye_003221 [Dipteronia dyeriana]
MGRASRWFRSILGLKKPDPTPPPPPPPTRSRSKEKRRWSFVKSYREKDYHHNNSSSTAKLHSLYGHHDTAAAKPSADDDDDATSEKHAIAVAAATAAVAEAAVAAAQAAAAVVRLTSSSGRCRSYPAGCRGTMYDVAAAIKIQSAFRGYLARRALRALKGLVRLQALVRGHIERKRTAEWLRRMQSLLRAQARARAGRAQLSESSQSSSKSSHFHHPGPPTPEKFEHAIRSRNDAKYEVSSVLKRNGSKSNGRIIGDHEKDHMVLNWSGCQIDDRSKDQQGPSTMKIGTVDDEKSDKILEIDNGKPRFTTKRRNLFHSSHLAVASDQFSHSFTTYKDSSKTHRTSASPSSYEIQSLSPLKVEEGSFCTADNSPQFFSASSRGGSSRRSPFTPLKSYGSQSCLSGYSDHPNYMSNTESSRAKVRSLSAPKQRPQYERSNSTKRYSVHGIGESKTSAQRYSSLHASFTNKAYPGSGRLDRLGMPVGQRY